MSKGPNFTSADFISDQEKELLLQAEVTQHFVSLLRLQESFRKGNSNSVEFKEWVKEAQNINKTLRKLNEKVRNLKLEFSLDETVLSRNTIPTKRNEGLTKGLTELNSIKSKIEDLDKRIKILETAKKQVYEKIDLYKQYKEENSVFYKTKRAAGELTASAVESFKQAATSLIKALKANIESLKSSLKSLKPNLKKFFKELPDKTKKLEKKLTDKTKKFFKELPENTKGLEKKLTDKTEKLRERLDIRKQVNAIDKSKLKSTTSENSHTPEEEILAHKQNYERGLAKFKKEIEEKQEAVRAKKAISVTKELAVRQMEEEKLSSFNQRVDNFKETEDLLENNLKINLAAVEKLKDAEDRISEINLLLKSLEKSNSKEDDAIESAKSTLRSKLALETQLQELIKQQGIIRSNEDLSHALALKSMSDYQTSINNVREELAQTKYSEANTARINAILQDYKKLEDEKASLEDLIRNPKAELARAKEELENFKKAEIYSSVKDLVTDPKNMELYRKCVRLMFPTDFEAIDKELEESLIDLESAKSELHDRKSRGIDSEYKASEKFKSLWESVDMYSGAASGVVDERTPTVRVARETTTPPKTVHTAFNSHPLFSIKPEESRAMKAAVRAAFPVVPTSPVVSTPTRASAASPVVPTPTRASAASPVVPTPTRASAASPVVPAAPVAPTHHGRPALSPENPWSRANPVVGSKGQTEVRHTTPTHPAGASAASGNPEGGTMAPIPALNGKIALAAKSAHADGIADLRAIMAAEQQARSGHTSPKPTPGPRRGDSTHTKGRGGNGFGG